MKPTDLEVPTLGQPRFDSPLRAKGRRFLDERVRVRFDSLVEPGGDGDEPLSFERAGPRERILFDPAETTTAFVTCGGLSPGLNNAIRSGYNELTYNYGVRRVLGIRNGFRGLDAASGLEPLELNHQLVRDIHHLGGTVLGSSRGGRDPADMVDFMEARGIDILFTIGGDGTQRGAHGIEQEIRRRGGRRAIVGIPKTIDNDVPFVYTSFGYVTALEVASQVLRGAHVEALAAPGGIGLVKLMGRDAGYIAAGAAVASQEANFVLVPEVPFPLEGAGGFLEALERRMESRGHALVVVAEGAGQHLIGHVDGEQDASGNIRYKDIGLFLRDRIRAHFAGLGMEINLKYIDPSYAIRSVPPGASDRMLTDRMARNAVHAAMAGKTDVMVGSWNQHIIWLPISAAVSQKKQMSLDKDLWNAVLATTGQPDWRP